MKQRCELFLGFYRSLYAKFLLIVGTLSALTFIISSYPSWQAKWEYQEIPKRNLIMMVSDGMGPSSLVLARNYRQFVESLPMDDVLTLDKHFWGNSRTRSTEQLVPDCAAGATAFSCGKKTYNTAIAVTDDAKPCGTVLEAAKGAGFMTGLVVTTDITDATPASFASHVRHRAMNDEIALQEIGQGALGRVVDLVLGGGRCHFLANTTSGSCRADDTDVVKIAQDQYGWNYIHDRSGFDSLQGGENVSLPLLGLVAGSDIPYEIDRRNMNDKYPGLYEMTTTALRALEKATEHSDQGFFLMIEASLIDRTGRINDPAAHVHEVLEYDRAFKAVVDFAKQSKTETLMLATSDHETGGLSLAKQNLGHDAANDWYPKVLTRVRASSRYLSQKYHGYLASTSGTMSSIADWVRNELFEEGLGIHDFTEKEVTELVEKPENALFYLTQAVNTRAHVGWSTTGHSAVDVNVYSSAKTVPLRHKWFHKSSGDGDGITHDIESIRGNIENVDIGEFMSKYLHVDLEWVTKRLTERSSYHEHQAEYVQANDIYHTLEEEL